MNIKSLVCSVKSYFSRLELKFDEALVLSVWLFLYSSALVVALGMYVEIDSKLHNCPEDSGLGFLFALCSVFFLTPLNSFLCLTIWCSKISNIFFTKKLIFFIEPLIFFAVFFIVMIFITECFNYLNFFITSVIGFVLDFCLLSIVLRFIQWCYGCRLIAKVGQKRKKGGCCKTRF